MFDWKPIVTRCPLCGGEMIQRSGYRGPFLGCKSYPACKGVFDINATLKPLTLLPGSPEQEAIWTALQKDQSHLVVNAVAGSGKTYTIVEGAKRMPPSLKIGVVAFNTHIAKELSNRFREHGVSHVRAMTYHALGFRACREAYSKLGDPYEDKLDAIIGEFCGDMDGPDIRRGVEKLVRLAKNYLLDGNNRVELEELADRHGVEVEASASRIFELVPAVLHQCRTRTDTIDYDDMVWLPCVNQLSVERFDLLLIDESQDTNKAQQELAFQAIGRKGRMVVVGDVHQACYGFRGADANAIPSLKTALAVTPRGVKELPLNYTRRCPKSHVTLVQTIVPEIQALPEAPEGEVLTRTLEQAIDIMQPGDLVLCRVNKDLIMPCYALIRKGVKAMIRGRDIGKGLSSLITKLRAVTLIDLLEKLKLYHEREAQKLDALGRKGKGRLQSLNDRVDCLVELCDGASTIDEVRGKISTIFSEFDDTGKPKNAVVFGTVHRTKGLEARTVFVLAPELLPHPMAEQLWEKVQEANLAYVAGTRSLDRLIFIGAIPPIFLPPEQQPTKQEAIAARRKLAASQTDRTDEVSGKIDTVLAAETKAKGRPAAKKKTVRKGK